jgi:hypothetical protein
MHVSTVNLTSRKIEEKKKKKKKKKKRSLFEELT